MAVGIIKTCEKCGKSYDSGRTSHWYDCDGGRAIREAQEEREHFSKMSVDDKFLYLYDWIIAMDKSIDNFPRGPLMIG